MLTDDKNSPTKCTLSVNLDLFVAFPYHLQQLIATVCHVLLSYHIFRLLARF